MTCLKKKTKNIHAYISGNTEPLGLIWDSSNYSCAYDAILTILRNIWILDPKHWDHFFKESNSQYLRILGLELQKNLNGMCSLENICDNIRHILHQTNSSAFPYGTRGTSIESMGDFPLSFFDRNNINLVHQGSYAELPVLYSVPFQLLTPRINLNLLIGSPPSQQTS